MSHVYVDCEEKELEAALDRAEQGCAVHVVATTAARARALRQYQKRCASCNPPVQLHFLPLSYKHLWDEFPAARTVWCNDDQVWRQIRQAQPGAARGRRPAGPTFPSCVLEFDGEVGAFRWRLPHGAALRAWGQPPHP